MTVLTILGVIFLPAMLIAVRIDQIATSLMSGRLKCFLANM